ncbi:hypothetical protein M427DRAFT_39115 [Gonapodya prolifera JEL478]|uniref:Uncharacterized protein n=1 Tax=Gonapodya prolifera (strain JEL478) TaxID=1344416 RepID=A0A138ZXX5_GONPJ|nr:hypothetical protein M427DRAFT_39115 [Gonapodya prolifera JEL478]|eukprot:KXS09339.1 hypothetical protein M427DRAFT_39115 [Gonapodya prolifera JEL478]
MHDPHEHTFTTSERAVSLLRTGSDGVVRLRGVDERCAYARMLLTTSAVWVPYRETLVAEWTLNAMWRKGAAGRARGRDGAGAGKAAEGAGAAMDVDTQDDAAAQGSAVPSTINPDLWSLLHHVLALPAFPPAAELKPPVLAIFSAALRDVRDADASEPPRAVLLDMRACLALVRARARNFQWAPYDAKCKLAAEAIQTLLVVCSRVSNSTGVDVDVDGDKETETDKDEPCTTLALLTIDLLEVVLEGTRDGTQNGV